MPGFLVNKIMSATEHREFHLSDHTVENDKNRHFKWDEFRPNTS